MTFFKVFLLCLCLSLAFSAGIDDNLLSDILDESEIEVDQLQAEQRVRCHNKTFLLCNWCVGQISWNVCLWQISHHNLSTSISGLDETLASNILYVSASFSPLVLLVLCIVLRCIAGNWKNDHLDVKYSSCKWMQICEWQQTV